MESMNTGQRTACARYSFTSSSPRGLNPSFFFLAKGLSNVVASISRWKPPWGMCSSGPGSPKGSRGNSTLQKRFVEEGGWGVGVMRNKLLTLVSNKSHRTESPRKTKWASDTRQSLPPSSPLHDQSNHSFGYFRNTLSKYSSESPESRFMDSVTAVNSFALAHRGCKHLCVFVWYFGGPICYLGGESWGEKEGAKLYIGSLLLSSREDFGVERKLCNITY